MAVTHDDLAPTPKGGNLGSKAGAFLMIFSILLGLFCFILSLIAESTRSEIINVKVKWTAGIDGGKEVETRCTYSGSGKLPLLSATAAFLALAMAMVVQHVYLLVAVSKSEPLIEITWDPESVFAKSLAWQAGFFFVSTWISFAVGEILLLIGLSVESGHLKNWAEPKPNCLTIRQGLFTAAGVLGLVTVFLASGLYITLLRAEIHLQDQETIRRRIVEASAMYASPAQRSPTIRAAPNEYPLQRQDQTLRNTLYYYLTTFDKHSTFV
ncbi:hypothetical protein ABFS82_14G005800 [Erythranthe guttata]